MTMIFPCPLKDGDRIAIISPATTVMPEYVHSAAELLRAEGFDPVIMHSALGPACGSFAAGESDRLADLKSAIHDKTVKGILCARGGYGCAELLPYLSPEEVRENPKWLIGFSDISALHALWQRAGVASIHGPMAKHMTLLGAGDPCTRALLSILRGDTKMDYSAAPSGYNIEGCAEGRLIGGNLAVLNGLAATPYDLLSAEATDCAILFLEDIAEPIYKVERVLHRLFMSGTLQKLNGLIIGQFTEYKPDKNFSSMEEMIAGMLRKFGISDIPVLFDFPTGHVDYNLPLIEGARVRLNVDAAGGRLTSCADSSCGQEVVVGSGMSLKEVQRLVDEWIRMVGGRYFSELTNMALLTEETGELARVIARLYGDQVAKAGDLRKGLEEEVADVLWVLTCIANQTGVDMTEAFLKRIEKKTSRDRDRFRSLRKQ